MKKCVVIPALTVAAVAVSAVRAETTLYGSARVSVDYNSRDITAPGGRQATWDVVDNTSRLGVQGSEALGAGLSAIYQFEFGVDPSEGGNFIDNRPRLIGLKSERYGTATIGTQWTPYYAVAGVSDVFNSGKSFFTGQYIGLYRQDNSIIYQSPDLEGLQLQGMVVVNGTDGGDNQFGNSDKGADLWNLAGIYKNGSLFAGATYIRVQGKKTPEPGFVPGDRDQYAAGLGYTMGPLAATFTYEYGDLIGTIGETDTAPTDNNRDYYGTLSYTLGNNILRLGGGKSRFAPRGAASFWVDNFLAGFEHDLSKRSALWVEYLRRDSGDEGRILIPSRDAVSIGMRHDF